MSHANDDENTVTPKSQKQRAFQLQRADKLMEIPHLKIIFTENP